VGLAEGDEGVKSGIRDDVLDELQSGRIIRSTISFDTDAAPLNA
jgi:hypothetical protein